METYLDAKAWRGYGGAEFPDASWSVEGDCIRAIGAGPRRDLISRKRFGDFDLSFEWRLPVGGNSGVLYRVDESAAEAWQSGPELQLLDNSTHPDGQVAETACGALYGLVAPQARLSCPPGLFNIGRIRVQGTQVEHWLNGARVLQCDLASAEFRRCIVGSKFEALPNFARAREGHIVLQHHGADAWFRNLRLGPPVARQSTQST